MIKSTALLSLTSEQQLGDCFAGPPNCFAKKQRKQGRSLLRTAGKITDLLSYYTLPSSIIGNTQYKTLKAAFMYYTVSTVTSLADLMTDALILARNSDHDVYNALDVLENTKFLKVCWQL